jgi:hypothetical protein
MRAIGHRFDEIESELDALTALRDKPAGTVASLRRSRAAKHPAAPAGATVA